MNKTLKILNQKRFFLSLVFLLLFLFVVFGYFLIRYQITAPLNPQAEEQTFIIEKNQGLKQIAANLEKENLIRGRIWFMGYILYKGWAANLQAGEYSLSAASSIPEIAWKVVSGEVIPNHIKVTIPEGFNIRQVDEQMTQYGLIEAGELADNYSHLEGYLFPDTYLFSKGSTIEEITAKFVSNFNQKLTEGLHNEIMRQEKTISEIVIMASIIEKEVYYYDDMRIVSGIFWKKVNRGETLKSCATLAYILGVNKWRYSIEDTEIDSPYNTYQNPGLPPGPICNPGLLSIQAAIYPQNTDYNYFLSKPGTGETVFSKTYEEHLENKEKYFQ